MIVIIEKECDNKKFGSNINEVIRAVLNFLLLFTKTFYTHQKAQKRNQAKAQNANKQTKIKNALKKYLSGKSDLFAYLRFCASEEKSLYNRNIGLTKPVKVLYKQKLVYWDRLKN